MRGASGGPVTSGQLVDVDREPALALGEERVSLDESPCGGEVGGLDDGVAVLLARRDLGAVVGDGDPGAERAAEVDQRAADLVAPVGPGLLQLLADLGGDVLHRGRGAAVEVDELGHVSGPLVEPGCGRYAVPSPPRAAPG